MYMWGERSGWVWHWLPQYKANYEHILTIAECSIFASFN